MHFPEGLFSIPYVVAWLGIALVFLLDSFVQNQKVFRRGTSEEKALLGMAGIFILAVTFVPIPVPFAGGLCLHICATPLVGLILGPRKVVLPAFVSLVAQVFVMGHGGLTTLGATLVSLGVVAPWFAFFIYRFLLLLRAPRVVGVFASVLVAIGLSAFMDSAWLTLSLYGWAAFQVWYPKMMTGLLSLRLPFAVVEAVLSALIIRGLARRRPSLLPDFLKEKQQKTATHLEHYRAVNRGL